MPCKKGIYNIAANIIIEKDTAPTKYKLVNNFISKMECLSDLHSNTWNNCDITNVANVKVLQVSKFIP